MPAEAIAAIITSLTLTIITEATSSSKEPIGSAAK